MSDYNVTALLETMEQIGASDLILTAGTPPQFRVHGLLQPHGERALSAEDTVGVVLEKDEIAAGVYRSPADVLPEPYAVIVDRSRYQFVLLGGGAHAR